MKKFVLIISTAIVVCLLLTTFACCSYISPSNTGANCDVKNDVASALLFATAPTPEHFSLPSGYTAAELDVNFSVKDYSFTVIGCYMFDTEIARFVFRVYQSELDYYKHYLQCSGYTFDGFSGWELAPQGLYYTANFVSLNDVSLDCIHTPLTYTVQFVDGIKGDVIQSLTASYGSTVNAPTPRDYSSDGLVFTGWDGGNYETVTRNTTLYSVYAPARYIDVTLPDNTVVRLTVAEGTKLSDVPAPEYNGKTLKYYEIAGERVDVQNTIIRNDMSVMAVYSGFEMPSWLNTVLIIVFALIISVLLIWVSILIYKRKTA